MKHKLGFIGGGAMAEAILSGAIAQKVMEASDIFVSELRADRCAELEEKYGVTAATTPDSFLDKVDLVLMAVKPQVADKAMAQLQGKLPKQVVLISIVAGLAIDSIKVYFPEQKIIRVMPNTPLSVGAGMSAYALGELATVEDAAPVQAILAACGKAIEVKESMLDAVTGLSGSGPAYGFLVIDALSDGGVAAGLPRDAAIMLAAQTMLGAAKMVLETGKHPDMLRDQVTSPAGTTIAGVRVMEQQGVRGALIDAVIAATERSAQLGKK